MEGQTLGVWGMHIPLPGPWSATPAQMNPALKYSNKNFKRMPPFQTSSSHGLGFVSFGQLVLWQAPSLELNRWWDYPSHDPDTLSLPGTTKNSSLLPEKPAKQPCNTTWRCEKLFFKLLFVGRISLDSAQGNFWELLSRRNTISSTIIASQNMQTF